ncbi:MAG TPA: biotin--[acetyl-CoA-carboxylase] ligase [Polyangiales bacterium]|nr:biotin--[acetyl-CoA-carboxylase] ligase [Polyangiales bacterium]
MEPQALDLDRLAQALQTQRYGRSITHKEVTGSTNDDARAAGDAGASAGHVVVADAQTSGRGSRGRSWASPPGTDLYLSILERLPVPLSELPPLTLAVGLGVAEAVDELLQSGAPAAQVKWPNDVQIQGKKCAGILVEASTGSPQGDAVVIGIGLNVNRTLFPPELTDNATSLSLQNLQGTPLDRSRALQVLLQHVEQRVDDFVRHGAPATVRALTPRLALLGRAARCDDQTGVVRGVAESGALLFETAHGLEHVIAGRLLPIP